MKIFFNKGQQVPKETKFPAFLQTPVNNMHAIRGGEDPPPVEDPIPEPILPPEPPTDEG